MTYSRKPADVDPVVKRMTVRCRRAEAFRYFTADFHKWWPGHTHSVVAMSSGGGKRPTSCAFEAWLGGRIVERGTAEELYVWGTVIVWEPPHRVAFTWHPGRDNQRAQTVEVTFTETDGGTDVVLTHSGFEKLASEASVTREGYNNGWEAVFNTAFREYVEHHQHQ